MNTSTQPQTAAPALAQATIPIQTGPVYHCFTCGAPAQGLRTWAEMPKWDGYSPLDEWGHHIAYLILPACPTSHLHRVAKLGDCITPLAFVQHAAHGERHRTISANIQAIRDALAALAAAIPESGRNTDTAANIVLSLMAGLMTPAAAIEQIQLLLDAHPSTEVPAHA
jgi:hypothetical protein